jgi:hypothetical protein
MKTFERRCRYCAKDQDVGLMEPDGVDYSLHIVRYRCQDKVACRRRKSDQELEEVRGIEERRFG